MMDAAQLRDWIREHFTEEAFRLEILQEYEVASDGSDYRRYLDGATTWTPERKQRWLDRLSGERDRGLYRRRVRIVTRPVTPYTRYECEWGYAPNVSAGEDVRILDVGEHTRADVGALDGADWHLVTDDQGLSRVAGMVYGDDATFRGAVERPARDVPEFLAARDALWAAAEPFATWWDRHRELHRDAVRAA